MSRVFADFGEVRKGDNGHYIKLDEGTSVSIKHKNYKGETVTVNLKPGDCLNLEKPEDKFTKIYRGDETKISERMEKLPDFIKFFVSASEKKD